MNVFYLIETLGLKIVKGSKGMHSKLSYADFNYGLYILGHVDLKRIEVCTEQLWRRTFHVVETSTKRGFQKKVLTNWKSKAKIVGSLPINPISFEGGGVLRRSLR
jgi:hypothetical protein